MTDTELLDWAQREGEAMGTKALRAQFMVRDAAGNAYQDYTIRGALEMAAKQKISKESRKA